MSTTPKEELLAELGTMAHELAGGDDNKAEEIAERMKYFIAEFGYLYTAHKLREVVEFGEKIRKKEGPRSRASTHKALKTIAGSLPNPAHVSYSMSDADAFFEGDW